MDAELPHRAPAAHVGARGAAAAPRYDIYAAMHKALRHCMNDALLNLGRLDAEDAAEFERTCAQVVELLRELRHHVRTENDYLHTSIEARRPAAAARTTEDHGEHLLAIADLEDELQVLRRAGDARRPVLAQQLYRHWRCSWPRTCGTCRSRRRPTTNSPRCLGAVQRRANWSALNGRLLAGIDPKWPSCARRRPSQRSAAACPGSPLPRGPRIGIRGAKPPLARLRPDGAISRTGPGAALPAPPRRASSR